MYKLQKIKRKDLDLKKYSKTLEASINYRIYAEYWYLDILTDEKWECWIYGDYEVVMPIPLQFKFGIKFVLQPIYCQQLGVFYTVEISDELFKEFEKKLHQYRVRAYHFNEENTERYNPEGDKRVNYVLDLNRPYEEIFANYKKKRRKDLNKGILANVEVRRSSSTKNHDFIQENYYKNLSEFTHDKKYKNLINKLLKKKLLHIYDLFVEDTLIASQFFIYSKYRIICSSFFRNKEIDSYNSSAFSKDFMIKNEAGKSIHVDFDGSSIAGVAEFYEGFGATKKSYTFFTNLHFFNKLVKI